MSNSVKIFCQEPTERHDFIFSLFFKGLLGFNYSFVDSIDTAHINYSDILSPSLSCIPQGLLSESSIREDIKDKITFEKWNNSHCFFSTGKGPLSYDIFSAAFYLVSRYEEWLSYEPDAHNRFPAEASILTQHNLLEEPLVNQWALALEDILLLKFPELNFKPREFSFLSTIDIDMMWKYKNKGIIRQLLGISKDILGGNWQDVKERIQTLAGLLEDPFYNFKWQQDFHSLHQVECKYFVLLGNYATYDKNTKHTHTQLVKLLRDIATYPNTSLGIHPSYASNAESKIVAKEINRLAKIIEQKPTMSRQHFLMHKMPSTYRTLIEMGINEDHTMGYSTHLGFRAGIAAPFLWFDLEENKTTELLLIPFCAMDITPLHYNGETMEQAVITLRKLVDKVKEVNGLYVSLWHNDSLSEQDRWRGWRKVYEDIVIYIQQ